MSSFCLKNLTLTVPKKASICINILVNHKVPCHLKEGVWHTGSQSKVCEYCVQEISAMFITTRHPNLQAGPFLFISNQVYLDNAFHNTHSFKADLQIGSL